MPKHPGNPLLLCLYKGLVISRRGSLKWCLHGQKLRQRAEAANKCQGGSKPPLSCGPPRTLIQREAETICVLIHPRCFRNTCCAAFVVEERRTVTAHDTQTPEEKKRKKKIKAAVAALPRSMGCFAAPYLRVLRTGARCFWSCRLRLCRGGFGKPRAFFRLQLCLVSFVSLSFFYAGFPTGEMLHAVAQVLGGVEL